MTRTARLITGHSRSGAFFMWVPVDATRAAVGPRSKAFFNRTECENGIAYAGYRRYRPIRTVMASGKLSGRAEA